MSAVGRSAAAVRTAPVQQSPKKTRLQLVELKRVHSLAVRGLMAVVVLAIIGLLAALYLHFILVEQSLKLDNMRQERVQVEVTNEQLQLRLALLQAPARITDEAVKLGMSEPDSVTYLDLSDSPLSEMQIRIVSSELESAP